MSLEILSNVKNMLMKRREVECVFKGAAGKVTRLEAGKALASTLKLSLDQVYLVGLSTESGIRDVKALFYIYDDPKEGRKVHPKHLLLRMLPKDERKKILDEKRRSKKG